MCPLCDIDIKLQANRMLTDELIMEMKSTLLNVTRSAIF